MSAPPDFAENIFDFSGNDWWGYANTDPSVVIEDIDCGGC